MKVLLIVYDNGSHIHEFPLGTAYVASALRDSGHSVSIYHQDVCHYPEDHLTDYLNNNKYDVVGCGIIGGYYQYRKLLKISDAINKSRHKPFYVLAGHGPSADPEFFLRKTRADAVVIGEGEVTSVELLAALEEGKNLSGVNGIAYMSSGKYVLNPERPVIKDIDDLRWPAFDLFPIDYYKLVRYPNCSSDDRIFPVLSGRGCPYKCNFCYRMDKGFRPRSNKSIMDEICYLNEEHLINYIVFTDELLMSSEERTLSVCNAMIDSGLKIKWWCNGRLNFATKNVLETMKRSGCVFINYGIESMDDTALKVMNKNLTVTQITAGIENTLSVGISPGLNIIWGNIGETAETLRKGVEFLLKYNDGAQLRTIRPVTPYPGSPLYNYAIEHGFIKDCEDFYENKHVNSDLLSVNFTDLSDEEYYKCLLEANTRLINHYYQIKNRISLEEAKKLYLDKNISFRGFRPV